jgi:hypothetical protein
MLLKHLREPGYLGRRAHGQAEHPAQQRALIERIRQ